MPPTFIVILLLFVMLGLDSCNKILLVCILILMLLTCYHFALTGGGDLTQGRLVLVDLPRRLVVLSIRLRLRLRLRLRRPGHLPPRRCALVHELVEHGRLIVFTAPPEGGTRHERCALLIAPKGLDRTHRELPPRVMGHLVVVGGPLN